MYGIENEKRSKKSERRKERRPFTSYSLCLQFGVHVLTLCETWCARVHSPGLFYVITVHRPSCILVLSCHGGWATQCRPSSCKRILIWLFLISFEPMLKWPLPLPIELKEQWFCQLVRPSLHPLAKLPLFGVHLQSTSCQGNVLQGDGQRRKDFFQFTIWNQVFS